MGTDIELPQLELVSNITGDCTSVYTTGQLNWVSFWQLQPYEKLRFAMSYLLTASQQLLKDELFLSFLKKSVYPILFLGIGKKENSLREQTKFLWSLNIPKWGALTLEGII